MSFMGCSTAQPASGWPGVTLGFLCTLARRPAPHRATGPQGPAHPPDSKKQTYGFRRAPTDRMRRRTSSWICAAALAVLFSHVAARGQSIAGGTVAGVVKDPNGGVVPGAVL